MPREAPSASHQRGDHAISTATAARPFLLPSKPLVEALLEIKWELRSQAPPSLGPVDPGYPYAVGRLFERVRKDYPFREELPVAQMPEGATPHLARFRFRKAAGGWPVVQIGPGVATVNFTETYTWDAFRAAVLGFVPHLRSVYDDVYPLKPTSVLLRYINAVELDYSKNDALKFLEEKMHVLLRLPEV